MIQPGCEISIVGAAARGVPTRDATAGFRWKTRRKADWRESSNAEWTAETRLERANWLKHGFQELPRK